MSEHKSYTCDRCGTPFERGWRGNTARFKGRWLTLGHSVQRVYIAAFNLTGDRKDHEPDLCASCEDSLAAWWTTPVSPAPTDPGAEQRADASRMGHAAEEADAKRGPDGWNG